MIGNLSSMRIPICVATTSAVFFVCVEHHANRATRLQSKFLQQPDCMPRDDTPTTIIVRALANIPRVVVTTQKYDLFWFLRTFDLSDDVCRLCIWKKLRLHLQTQRGMVSAVIHSL